MALCAITQLPCHIGRESKPDLVLFCTADEPHTRLTAYPGILKTLQHCEQHHSRDNGRKTDADCLCTTFCTTPPLSA